MSLDIRKDYPLKAHNTFAIDSIADTFITINSVADLIEAVTQLDDESCLVLGGGSNLLFDQERIENPVFWVNIKGIEELEAKGGHVIIKAMAGENWHDFVLWCLQRDYGGLENLSLIPGSVGAAPVQNIGAYGVEVKDTLHQVEALNLNDGMIQHFSLDECELAYRDSIFKGSQRGQWVILSVSFRLTRHEHQLKLGYGAIRETLQAAGIDNPMIQDVSNTVIQIRQEKLPDPKIVPNAGSFFKNPVVNAEIFKDLKHRHPGIPGFELPDGKVKIPAGWLIDQCGWKGRREGNCGVHQQHALVLVNYGNATGADILHLADRIEESVMHSFELSLTPEVNVSSDAAFAKD
jgi:UDP-N-acetylmuramate dehydrogenase